MLPEDGRLNDGERNQLLNPCTPRGRARGGGDAGP
jgi:hypothetical protein